MKRHTDMVPAAVAFVLIAFVGYAFIKLGAERRAADARLNAEQIAETSAQLIERKLQGALASVDALAEDIGQRGRLDDSKTLGVDAREQETSRATLFRVFGGHVVGMHPAQGSGLEDFSVEEWTTEANSQAQPLVQTPEVLGPLRMASTGEWTLLVRLPVVLSKQAGASRFVGWAVASLRLEDLLRSSGLAQLSSSGYDYRLSYLGSGERQRTLSRSTEFDLKAPLKKIIPVARDQWVLWIAPKDGWFPWPPLVLQSMLVAVLAVGGSVSTYDLARRRQWFHRQIEKRSRRLRTANRRLMEEIQQREDLEEQFSHASFHDALTGLPNRRYLMDRLERALERTRRNPGSLLAVILLDLDRFKNINESLGHAAGDELLTQAAHRVGNSLRPSDLVVAHLGGDEFAMLLFDILSAETAVAATEP